MSGYSENGIIRCSIYTYVGSSTHRWPSLVHDDCISFEQFNQELNDDAFLYNDQMNQPAFDDPLTTEENQYFTNELESRANCGPQKWIETGHYISHDKRYNWSLEDIQLLKQILHENSEHTRNEILELFNHQTKGKKRTYFALKKMITRIRKDGSMIRYSKQN